MYFLEIARLIITEFAGIEMTVFENLENVSRSLADFEKRYCFLPAIQPVYTAKGLHVFFEKQEKNRIFEITDRLDTHVIIINIENRPVILGPYVTTSWQDTEAKIRLTKCSMGADLFVPYKMYWCNLPTVGQYNIVRVASLVLKNAVIDADLDPIILELSDSIAKDDHMAVPEIYSKVERINRRYAWEFELMDTVQRGDTERAIDMIQQSLSLDPDLQFLTSSLNDKIASAYATRVLIRHAALKAGLMPFSVDALSQEYAQKMHRATDIQLLSTLLKQYVTAICQAIRENNKTNYSPYVKHAIQYIDLRLSQSITANDLCAIDHITRQYFALLFKKETGMTVKQYITQARCERAAELLKNSDLSIQQISQYVGYEDANYFARLFKSYKGSTPQLYRKERKVL